MKPGLIILLVICGLFNSAFCQTAHSAIDSLVKYKVITARQRPILEKELKNRRGASYRVAILGGLEDILLQKEFHVDPHKTGLFYSYNYNFKTRDARKQDSINTSLLELLDKINQAKLLSDKVYSNTKNIIDTGGYVVQLQVVSHLAEMSSRLERLAPEKLLPVAEQLHKCGVVNDSSFLRLQDDIRQGKIESEFQLNDYCQLDRTFEVPYLSEPDIWLERLHYAISSILPGLSFTDFHYTKSPDSSAIGKLPGVKFNVSLVCNGRIYKSANTAITFKGREGKLIYSFAVLDFYRIFNKILTDQQSPYRLHTVLGSNIHDHAFIALREDQAEDLMDKPTRSFMLLSFENYDNSLISSRIDSAIAKWKNIGLFAYLSATQIKIAADEAKASDWFSLGNLLFSFPNAIYSLPSSMSDSGYLYVNLLNHLAGITRGALVPIQITQSKIKGGIKLEYRSKEKIHSYIFKTEYGWLDKKFPLFMKELGRENNLPGDFYALPYENAVIYLTPQQHDYIAGHHLLDFDIIKHTAGKGK